MAVLERLAVLAVVVVYEVLHRQVEDRRKVLQEGLTGWKGGNECERGHPVTILLICFYLPEVLSTGR